MSVPSPFHAGEQAVQTRLGAHEVERWAHKAVRDHLPDQHRAFYTSLPFLVAAARDADVRPWATLLAGSDGFVTSPNATTLIIDAHPLPGDALEGALNTGDDLGILGIELSNRRRNRANGHMGREGDALVFHVHQAFGNCPRYVNERSWRRVPSEAGSVSRTDRLSAAQRHWIESTDTFFIASGYRGAGESPAYGMDASHRGGPPGFVRTVNERQLVFPDYAGNNFFNTIGNLELDHRVGITFVGFGNGSLLQLSGRATIDWESEAVRAVPGARRLVVVDVDAVVELPHALSLRW